MGFTLKWVLFGVAEKDRYMIRERAHFKEEDLCRSPNWKWIASVKVQEHRNMFPSTIVYSLL